jgi:hypothetical protein
MSKINVAKAQLEVLGFRGQELPVGDRTSRQLVMWRRIQNVEPVCATNDRLSLHVTFNAFLLPNMREVNEGCSIDITGEIPGANWTTLQIYGISIEEVAAKIPEVERRLVAAWKAVCAA